MLFIAKKTKTDNNQTRNVNGSEKIISKYEVSKIYKNKNAKIL